jgi:hypothetical protein
VTEEIAFVDQGENFEKIQCPRCGAELSTPWWQGAMSRSFESKFRQMDITTPCCRCATTLNDLIYIFPAGFARFQLRARGPKKPQLTPQEQSQLEQILRTPLKQIWVHYSGIYVQRNHFSASTNETPPQIVITSNRCH